MTEKGPSISRTALMLLPVHAAFRGAEALVPVLLATWFGRTEDTDVYYLMWAFFTFAGAFVASAFQDSALIPVLARLQAEEKEYIRVLRSLFGHAVIYAAGLGVGMGTIALAWLGATGTPHRLALGAALVPAFALYLVALSARALFVGALNQRGKYAAYPLASGAGVASALAAIAVLRGAWGVRVLPLAWFLQEVVTAGLAFAFLSSLTGARLSPSLAKPEPVARFFRLVAWEVAGSGITRLNPVVDQVIAGFAPLTGAGTLLRYVFDVASLPTSAAQAAVFPVLLSHLARQAAAADWDAFQHTVRRSLAGVGGLLILATAALVVLRGPLLRLVFLHGRMDGGGIDAMMDVLPYALVGVAPFGALLILARAHVALQNSRIMVTMGLFNAGLNAVLDVALFPRMGLRGIALATSVMQLGVAVVFWIRLQCKVRELRGAKPWSSLEAGGSAADRR